jgi:hypothetical protein
MATALQPDASEKVIQVFKRGLGWDIKMKPIIRIIASFNLHMPEAGR